MIYDVLGHEPKVVRLEACPAQVKELKILFVLDEANQLFYEAIPVQIDPWQRQFEQKWAFFVMVIEEVFQ